MSMFQNKKRAFTLAEVLVTLGIIGVIAAMTIPTLMSNTKGAKFRSQYKKTLSTLNQAAVMTQVQYDLDYSNVSPYCNESIGHPDADDSVCGLLGAALTGHSYLKTARLKVPSGGNYEPVGPNIGSLNVSDFVFVLSDGSIVAIPEEMANCTLPIETNITQNIIETYAGLGFSDGTVGLNQCLGYIDVNGADGPNREVSCSNGVTTEFKPDTPCVVNNDSNSLSDVFPVVFHDTVVEPATNAAKFVLTSVK